MKDIIYRKTVKTAEKLFNRFGFAKTAMSDIAAQADVSRATIFNNFGSKEGVLQAVLDLKMKEYKEEAEKVISSSKSSYESMKLIIFKRLSILSGLKFISDKQIASDSSAVRKFKKELNAIFIRLSGDVLRLNGKGRDEIKRILNTIALIIKGVEAEKSYLSEPDTSPDTV